MESVRFLLGVGNTKLGRVIAHFDLPGGSTCPGKSRICDAVCYAKRSRFQTRKVRTRLRWNQRQSLMPDFAQRMIDEIGTRGLLVVRIHVAGDWFSLGYLQKWIAIVEACPTVRFYAYTRSWRVAGMVRELATLASLPNMRLWYSCDTETGEPEEVPQGVRLAWLQHEPEAVPRRSELTFRVHRLRRLPVVDLPMVCPHETGQMNNCGQCRHCWQ